MDRLLPTFRGRQRTQSPIGLFILFLFRFSFPLNFCTLLAHDAGRLGPKSCTRTYIWTWRANISGTTTTIYYYKIYSRTLRKWKITKGICVCSLNVYHDIYDMLRRVPPYVSGISGTVAIACALFSPLPYLDVLRRRLHFLICPSDCLSWYCEWKWAFWVWLAVSTLQELQ